MHSADHAGSDPRRVNPVVERLAAYGWRLLVVSAVAVGLVWLLGQLWVPVMALTVALFLARILDAPARWLRGRGLPASAASFVSLIALLGLIALFVWLIVPSVAEEFSSLGTTVSEGLDNVEEWLITDAPGHISQADIDKTRHDVGESVGNVLRSSGGTIISGTVVAAELLTGLVLALVTTFFVMKDGSRFQSWALERLPAQRREPARRMGGRAWQTLGGYLRGSATLGVLEGIIIGVTMAIVGAPLAIPVAVLTFAAAFIPMVGAVVAGVVAVLVTLATAGFGAAVIVAVVALLVQQFDNDLLSPLVFGRALELHPLVILFSIVAGGALFGFAGTVLAVPVTAVVVNVLAEAGVGQVPDESAADEGG